jgi:hypothetical protein
MDRNQITAVLVFLKPPLADIDDALVLQITDPISQVSESVPEPNVYGSLSR